MFNLDNIYRYLIKLYHFPQVYFFNGFALPPLHAFFDTTYHCNLKCDMCHSMSLIENANHRKELTTDQITKLIRKLPRKTLISFTGGEPFCRKDMMEILSTACKEYKCHIITNGTLITEEMAKTLVELGMRSFMSPGLIMVGLSIEGPENIHDEIVGIKGSFQKTVSVIKTIQKMKEQAGSTFPKIHMTTVITQKNAAFLSDVYSLAKDLKLDHSNFVLENTSQFYRNQCDSSYDVLYQPPPHPAKIDPELLHKQFDLLENMSSSQPKTMIRLSPDGITRKEIVKYFSEGQNYQDFRCHAPWSKIGFSAYGDVFCCPHVKIGNVLKSNYNILWGSNPYKQFRVKLKKEKIFPLCVGCCQSKYIGK